MNSKILIIRDKNTLYTGFGNKYKCMLTCQGPSVQRTVNQRLLTTANPTSNLFLSCQTRSARKKDKCVAGFGINTNDLN